MVWEKDVGILKINHTYKIPNVTVRRFSGSKYVSLSERSTIKEAKDIGEVVEDSVDMGPDRA